MTITADLVIDEPSYGAFTHTSLEPELRRRGIVHLYFAGVTADVCVHTTVRERPTVSVSVAAIKDAHWRGQEADFACQLHHEADTQGWLQQQPDFAEAAQAFAEKRPARLAARKPPATSR